MKALISRPRQRVFLLVFFSFAVLVLSPFFGSSMSWSLRELFYSSELGVEIFWRIRLPRVFLGFLTGAALGGAGVAFQALFRNSLASPYTLGVASGASFGAVTAIRLGFVGSFLGVSGLTLGGMAGAIFVTALICFVSGGARPLSGTAMLLAGVAMSFFFSSMIMFSQYLSNFTQSFQIVRWLMGGLEVVDFDSALHLLPFVLGGSLLLFRYRYELDAISTGEELAYGRGVDVKRLRGVFFFAISLMVGAAVSFAGPIGFVGIMVPHMCRLLVGPSHRVLVPVSLLVSGAFLVACDAVARVVSPPSDIPVGIITALLGGPFFLWLLLRKEGIRI